MAAAIDRANCRRVIPILIPHAQVLRLLQVFFPRAQKLVEPVADSAVAAATPNSGELYLTPQVEFSFCLTRLRQLNRLERGSNVMVLEFALESCPFITYNSKAIR